MTSMGGSDLCKMLLTHSRRPVRSASADGRGADGRVAAGGRRPDAPRHPPPRARRASSPAGEIATHFPSISRPAVSQHLRVLADAGLVEVRPDGNRRLYRWRREGLRDAAAFVEEMWSDRLARLKAAAEREEWPSAPAPAGPNAPRAKETDR